MRGADYRRCSRPSASRSPRGTRATRAVIAHLLKKNVARGRRAGRRRGPRPRGSCGVARGVREAPHPRRPTTPLGIGRTLLADLSARRRSRKCYRDWDKPFTSAEGRGGVHPAQGPEPPPPDPPDPRAPPPRRAPQPRPAPASQPRGPRGRTRERGEGNKGEGRPGYPHTRGPVKSRPSESPGPTKRLRVSKRFYG